MSDLHNPAAHPISTSDEAVRNRRRRVYLSIRRDELLVPIQEILDISDQLLRDPKALEHREFIKDVGVVHESAQKLRNEISELLSNSDSTLKFEDASHQSKVRHELRNLLNPVINYPEMWIEDAHQFFLQDFIPDLDRLLGMGKRCQAFLDTLLDSASNSPLGDDPWSELEEISTLLGQVRQPPTTSPTIPGRLLVVDDNQINRDIVRRLLETLGHEVLEAENGRVALETLRQESIDLVLLDILMPDVNGYQTLSEMKKDRILCEIPVVMISALTEIDIVARCIELGAEDCLSRPFNKIILKARVDACLEKKRFRAKEREYLNQIQRERERADELLHVILPGRVVTELKETNRCVPRRFDRVAVLFADIVNFTPYCEKHSPEHVVEHLQKLFETWEELSIRFKVQKIKTIGDAYMAACGLLSHEENPVLQCIRLGSEMIAATRALPTGWDLRVGIHVGQVVAGVLGKRQYLYDLFGDTVNTAARMESHGVHGGIVISNDALHEVRDVCRVVELERITVKGKGDFARNHVISFPICISDQE